MVFSEITCFGLSTSVTKQELIRVDECPGDVTIDSVELLAVDCVDFIVGRPT